MIDPVSSESRRPMAPFGLSLVAGLWMMISGATVTWCSMGGAGWYDAAPHRDHHATAPFWTWHHGMLREWGGEILWSWAGFAAGLLTVLAAIYLYRRPSGNRACGIVIITASTIGLLAGAGGILAGLLGILGGVYAIRAQ